MARPFSLLSIPWLPLGLLIALVGLGAACGEIRVDAMTRTESDLGHGGYVKPSEYPAGGEGGSDDGHHDDEEVLEEPAVAGELCSPCTKNSQCGDDNDLCITFHDSDDYHCGRHCHKDRDCPDGYECVRVRSVDSDQCVPISRTCPPEL